MRLAYLFLSSSKADNLLQESLVCRFLPRKLVIHYIRRRMERCESIAKSNFVTFKLMLLAVDIYLSALILSLSVHIQRSNV